MARPYLEAQPHQVVIQFFAFKAVVLVGRRIRTKWPYNQPSDFKFSLIYAAFFVPEPLVTVSGATSAENRPNTVRN